MARSKATVLGFAATALVAFGTSSALGAMPPAGHRAAGSRAAAVAPKLGRHVPGFAFTGLDGRSYRLADFSGHYVLLDFWATWCSLCLEEEPTLVQASKRFRDRGLLIVGLDSDKDAARALSYIRQHQLPWPESAPASTQAVLAHVLKVKWYPALILLDPEGKIVLVSGNGGRYLRGEKLLHALDGVLPPTPVAGAASSSTGE